MMESLYKCVWMTAGVLNYRLCDRQYDCDHCLVDTALREGKAPAGGVAAASVRRDSEGIAFLTNRAAFYHPCHLWARVGSAGTVRVGLDGVASRLLGHIREIRLPEPGTTLHRGQPAWTFVSDVGDVELPSPITGRILSRNEELILDPENIERGGYQETWFARIRPTRLREDLESLTYGRLATEWLRRELDKIRGRVLSAHTVSTGTLPDGGTLTPVVLDCIDLTLRRSLVEEILLSPARRQKGR
jgi:glycine cleavage system H protein